MINLLSKEAKAELAAAQRNIHLRNYVFTVLILGAVITASYAVGYFILDNQAGIYRETVAQYAPEKAKFQPTIKEAATYNANLTIAKSIFSNEFAFSDFTITIAKTLPKNTALDSLRATITDLDKPVDLTFRAKSYDDAVALKIAFQSSPYFKDTKLRSINYEFKPGFDYPYITTLITTFSRTEFMKDQKEGTL